MGYEGAPRMDDVEQHPDHLIHDDYRITWGDADLAITAYKAWLKDNGWAIVPRKLSAEGIEEFWRALEKSRKEGYKDFVDAARYISRRPLRRWMGRRPGASGVSSG